MKEATAVVDTGTTSVRVVLFDNEGNRLGVYQRSNPPRYLPDGLVEQDPTSWPTTALSLLAEAADDASTRSFAIGAISLTSQRSSVTAVAADGTFLSNAIMWQDRRSEPICRRYESELPMIYQRTGIRLTSVFSAPKIRWLLENRPDVFSRTAKFVGVQDLLLYTLTGKFVTDHSFAGRTNLLNLETRSWDPELLELFGIDVETLCDLVPPGSVVGTLLPAAADRTGLRQGIPVISAGGDQQCAALGMGLYGEGRIVTNTGTGSYALADTPSPKLHDGMGLFCNPSAVPERYTVEATVPTTGSVYRWLGALLYGDDDPIARLNSAVEQSPPGSNGLRLEPHFQGSGSPDWVAGASGIITGLSLATSAGDLGRAVLEGIAAELRRNVDLICDLAGAVTEVRSSGGLTEFPLFNQILADNLELPVFKLSDGESTARGAWISAVVSLGIYESHAAALGDGEPDKGTQRFEPLPENTAVYGRSRSSIN